MFQFYTTDFLLYTADFLFQRRTSKGRLVTKILGCNRHLMFYTALNPSIFTDVMIGQFSVVCSFFSFVTPCLTVSIPSLKVLFFTGYYQFLLNLKPINQLAGLFAVTKQLMDSNTSQCCYCLEIKIICDDQSAVVRYLQQYEHILYCVCILWNSTCFVYSNYYHKF